MPVVEHDDMIEHVAANTANDPLAVRILPGTSWGDLDLFDAQMLDALLQRSTVNGVSIAEEISRCGVPRKRLDDLLGRPLCRWVFGDVEMHDTPPFVSQQDKHKQNLEASSWDGEKITRHDILDMIIEKCLPCG